jgi:hypothetical protein
MSLNKLDTKILIVLCVFNNSYFSGKVTNGNSEFYFLMYDKIKVWDVFYFWLRNLEITNQL